jgi:hypothetical protein
MTKHEPQCQKKKETTIYYLDTTKHARSLVSYMYIKDKKIMYSLSVRRRKRQLRNIISLSGFRQVALWSSPDGLRLKELKEYSVSYSAPDYLGPVLGSKCPVMQTLGDYLGLGPFGGNLGEDVSGCHPDF